MKPSTCILLLLLISACKSQNEKVSTGSFTLSEVGEIAFPIDTLTSALKTQVQYCPQTSNSKPSLILTNLHTNEIVFFDLTTRKPVSRLKLEVNGQNGVGIIGGSLYHNKDSIFVYNYRKATVYLVNAQGKVLNKYVTIGDKDYKFPNVAECYQPHLTEGYLHLNSWGAENFYEKPQRLEENLMVRINIKNGQKATYLKYPDLYKKAIWGVQLYPMYNNYNALKREEVFSFVADDSITVRSSGGRITRHYAGSKFSKLIEPLSYQDKLVQIPEIEKEVENQVLQTTYGQIWSDPYTGYTYRIVYKPLTVDQLKTQTAPRGTQQDFSIVILSPTYEVIGELEHVPYTYSGFKVFFTPKGMYMLKSASTDENNMIFAHFQLKKL